MLRSLVIAVVWGAVLVGVVGAGDALHGRGSEELFRYEQSRASALRPATVLSPARVEAVVAEAPEPVSAARRTRPAWVRCQPGASGTLRDPWSCMIRYRSGTRAHYRVIVGPDGSYSGVGTGIIEGCCVKTPTLD